MQPGARDFINYAGSTFYASVLWYDDEDDVIDLANYSARMEIRTASDKVLVDVLTTENGRILHRDDGGLTLWIDDDDTRDHTPGVHRYDLILRQPDALVPDPLVERDYVFPLMAGKWTTKALVTVTEPEGDTP